MWDVFFSGAAAWFSIPAFVGTGLFILKMILMFAGGDHHDALAGHEVSGGLDHAHDVSDGGDADLKLISVQGVLAFLMAFGWVGLLVLASTRAQLVVASAAGLVAGFAAMYAMARLMSAMLKLQASGTIDARAAVGIEGTVYVTVPEGGKGMGQVTLVIDQKQRTYNAVSSGPELTRNVKVRVLAVQGQNTLAVEPAE